MFIKLFFSGPNTVSIIMQKKKKRKFLSEEASFLRKKYSTESAKKIVLPFSITSWFTDLDFCCVLSPFSLTSILKFSYLHNLPTHGRGGRGEYLCFSLPYHSEIEHLSLFVIFQVNYSNLVHMIMRISLSSCDSK